MPAIHRIGRDAFMQVGLLCALWSGYAGVRELTGDASHLALDNAARLLDLEARYGVNVEQALQTGVQWPQAFVAANVYYLLHFPITLIVMTAAFVRSRYRVFPVLRNTLIASTTVALIVHLVVPMAPPRMLPGFIDASNTYGPDPYAIPGSGSANQFAAMPSMHVAWAVIAGYAIWHLTKHPTTRFAAMLHPLLTTIVVIVTGHHFLTDVAVGATLAAAVLAATTAAARQRSRRDSGSIQRQTRASRAESLAAVRVARDKSTTTDRVREFAATPA